MLDLRATASEHIVRVWHAWRNDAPETRCARLHLVCIVPYWRHAISAHDWHHGLTRLLDTSRPLRPDSDPQHVFETADEHSSSMAPAAKRGTAEDDFEPLRQTLNAAWPPPVAGMHRIAFENGQFQLTLVFSSVAEALGNLWLRADQILIDGWTDERGPRDSQVHSVHAQSMHTRYDERSQRTDDALQPAELIKGIARLAADQALLRIDHLAPSHDKALRHTGFEPFDGQDSESRKNPEGHESREGRDSQEYQQSPERPEVPGAWRTYRFAPRWRVRRYEPPLPATVLSRSAMIEAANRFLQTPFDRPDHGSSARPEHHVESESTSNTYRPAAQTRKADVLIIGAGLAGCALAERLSARGFRLILIDEAQRLASGASGNPAGVFHPVIANDDSLASRATRAGFLYSLAQWHSLTNRGFNFDWRADGLVQVATTHEEEASLKDAIAAGDLPPDLVRYVTAEDAYRFLGVRPAFGGLLFAHGGVVNPASLCHAQLRAAQCSSHVDTLFGHSIAQLERVGEDWRALSYEGTEIARAPIVVVANANHASRLAGLDHAPTRPIRGQLSWIHDTLLAALRHPLIGDGYLLPCRAGDTLQLTGASYELDDTDTTLRPVSQQENLARLQRLVPDAAESIARQADTSPLAGRVALRCATSDRMPMIGQLADEAASRNQASRLSGAWPLDIPRQTGLYGAYGYGSRGLVWAALGAELIASQIAGEPLPVPRGLADAFDPARFLIRALRQREIH